MKKGISVFSLCLAALAVVLPNPALSLPDVSKRIRIMTTVFPIMEFAKRICGPRGEVEMLLPPGVEVHTWQPRASDVLSLSKTDLLIAVGANLEPWLPGLVGSVANPRMIILDASRGLDLIRDRDEGSSPAPDPHYWLDFSLDQRIVEKITDTCCGLSPGDAGTFRQNAALLNERLKELDGRFRKSLAGCKGKDFVIGGHGAFGYLARRYGLRQIALYGLSPDSEPTPRQVAQVISFVKKNEIAVIFYEKSDSSKLARMVASETGARTLVLSAAHNLTKEQFSSGMTFFDLMQEDLDNLRTGLGCD